jgi:hypothetical protein
MTTPDDLFPIIFVSVNTTGPDPYRHVVSSFAVKAIYVSYRDRSWWHLTDHTFRLRVSDHDMDRMHPLHADSYDAEYTTRGLAAWQILTLVDTMIRQCGKGVAFAGTDPYTACRFLESDVGVPANLFGEYLDIDMLINGARTQIAGEQLRLPTEKTGPYIGADPTAYTPDPPGIVSYAAEKLFRLYRLQETR